ncbi:MULTISPECIES: SNF2-related protein [Psychrilyobacter]|uniref:Superfamily II DNA or RNA helicase, SNF2 family n=1 Tax=Psychrilyobacter piezotolerans TaxID=2293438 RepID=A0ABX9KI92_9FUSO|nr:MULTISPECIES: SNF2-related protein [Psychrilyobacter]MCS5420947.1 SNF2-related protein [Psychrilyobacter sp. S5]NDI77646.1 DEAD/DEAH box helicase family protein [Psychrilyobacter piezotolerans]RDE62654.1 hypothetical protein DV867_06660 [Psychrilyobacter sp. S5]REI41584.1 hypothetical protein DYH56_06660 [Psychrilyobacter piezotolerans]
MNISKREVKLIAGDISNYNRGLKSFKSNLCEIENAEYNWDDLEIEFQGTALGTKMYNFDIKLNIDVKAKDDRIMDYNCNCPAFDQYDRACKHIIGGLLTFEAGGYLDGIEEHILESSYSQPLLEVEDLELIHIDCDELEGLEEFEYYPYDEPDYNTPNKSRETLLYESLKKYEKSLEKTENIEEKIELETEYYLERENIYSYRPNYFLKIKIGIVGKRKYVVKDVVQFIDSYKHGKILEFGKEFEFNPAEHKLTDYDYKLLDQISRMCKITEEFLTKYNGYHISSVRKGKISLTNEWFKMFLENISGNENIKLDNEKMKLSSLEEANFTFINKKSLGVEPFSVLTDGAEFIATQAEIYPIKKKDRELIKILYDAASLQNGSISRAGELGKTLTKLVKNTDLGTIEFLDQVGEPIIFIDENRVYRNVLSIDIKVSYQKEMIVEGKKYLLNEDKKKTAEIFKEVTGLDQRSDFNTSLYGKGDVLEFFLNKLPKLNEKYNVQIDENLNRIKMKKVSIDGTIIKNGDLLEITFDTNGISEDDLKAIQLGLLNKKKYVKLSDDGIVDLADKKLRELEGTLAELDFELGTQQISEFTASKLGLISPSLNMKNVGDLKIEKLLKSIKNNEREIVPKSINATLRNYQNHGYDWMKKLHDSNLGGILADDMGLGKTLQAIALLTAVHSEQNGRSIVIAPTSLTHNWLKEIRKFSPELNAVIVEGSVKERKELLNNFKNGVILTSYGSFKKDIENYENLEFLVAMLDEAQNIKNSGTLVKKAVQKIKSSSRFALTGTPIENSIFELWSIFDFVLPTYLHSREKFKRNYGKKINQDMDEDCLINLKKLIKPFILRRTKSEVLKELPEKIVTNMILGMDTVQKKYYLSYLSKFKEELKDNLEEEFDKSRIKILALLTRLRQICCTPELFIENYKGKSAKVEALIELLEELKSGGHRVLVFSQFVKSFEIIKKQLDLKKITHFQIDGRTKAKKRLEMCDSFNGGEKDIFLISLKAGGSGLNLTGADVVIHFDPWWNPAIEAQATDRAHRIGQDKVVQVIKLITEGTVEEKIIEIQEKKSHLINSMVDSKGKIEKLTKKDILELFE